MKPNAYHCEPEATPGLDRGETTPQVRHRVALLAPHLGFATTAQVLEQTRALNLIAATVERIAVRVGTSLRQEQHDEAHLHHQERLPDRRTACPRRLYIGADGLMMPLREMWKQDYSPGSLTCRYGECKTGVVYEAAADTTGRDARVRTRAYTATLQGVGTFERLPGTLVHRCGYHAAREVVTLGDGALWIGNMFGRLFPGSIQILDFYHACDHLVHVAEAMYGKDIEAGRQWQKAHQADLNASAVGGVVAAIDAWEPATAAQRDIRVSKATVSATMTSVCGIKRISKQAAILAVAWWKPLANTWWHSVWTRPECTDANRQPKRSSRYERPSFLPSQPDLRPHLAMWA